ncbi:MAG: hypothetical protein VX527_03945 [Planctomycetota bacterium]|nr:hypothetical protein [Planctomycetota bacterium]
MTPKRAWFAATAIMAVSGSVLANSTASFLDASGNTINIASGEFADILVSPGEHFSAADMAAVNTTLQQHGIQTQGRISIMLVETGAGLSILTMFDGVEIPEQPGPTSLVTMTAFVPTTATWQYNIDAGGTFNDFPIGGETMLNGSFIWDSGVNSEAMAVSSLAEGDSGSLFLSAFDLGDMDTNGTIQMLTMNGGAWTLPNEHILDFEPSTNPGEPDNQYLQFQITNIPAPSGLLLLALAGHGRRRRRRD